MPTFNTVGNSRLQQSDVHVLIDQLAILAPSIRRFVVAIEHKDGSLAWNRAHADGDENDVLKDIGLCDLAKMSLYANLASGDIGDQIEDSVECMGPQEIDLD